MNLQGKCAAVVGLGGLGSHVSLILSASGVGKLILIDKDRVEEKNLGRQVLYNLDDVGRKKAISAKKLAERNKNLKISVFDRKFSEEMIENADVVIDCLDNLKDKKRLNGVCVKMGKSLVFGSASGSVGMVAVIIPKKTACLNCFIKKGFSREETAADYLPAIIGSIQAAEALKILSGPGNLMQGLLYVDIKRNIFETIKIRKDAKCGVCSSRQ